MPPALLKFIVQVAQILLGPAFWLALLFAETARAKRIERMCGRLSRMGQKLTVFTGRVRAGHFAEAIDADVSFRAELNEIKEDMRLMRCQVAVWRSDQRTAGTTLRLTTALATLSRLSEEVFAAADQLQWEIAEHDARLAAASAQHSA
jgi:hypothetical protein